MLHNDTNSSQQRSRPSNLGENMVDVWVHKALLVSVLGHPQDFGGNGGERWDGDVHVVPGRHREQRGDLGVNVVETFSLWAWVHSRVTLRTDDAFTFVGR